MADERPSHPYRDLAALAKAATAPLVRTPGGIRQARAMMRKLSDLLDDGLSGLPRADLVEVLRDLRDFRQELIDARRTLALLRGFVGGAVSLGAVTAIAAALERHPTALVVVGVLLLIAAVPLWRSARAVGEIDDIVEMLDHGVARIERECDRERADNPMRELELKNKEQLARVAALETATKQTALKTDQVALRTERNQQTLAELEDEAARLRDASTRTGVRVVPGATPPPDVVDSPSPAADPAKRKDHRS